MLLYISKHKTDSTKCFMTVDIIAQRIGTGEIADVSEQKRSIYYQNIRIT